MTNQKTNIFIPKKLKIGYNERSNTYTKKLAYIIYYDTKNKLRKEPSWNSWKNDKIPVDDYDNEPQEGFVLNKKVGGNNGGWNPRQTYCRVYDPRGFEFEITIPNLLFILENTNSIVGKGLVGKFVYGWQGADLILIPENAKEYTTMMSFTALQSKKITKKELKLGSVYKTKQNSDVVYLGYYPTYKHIIYYTLNSYDSNKLYKSKKHWFYDIKLQKYIYKGGYSHLAEEIADSNIDLPFIMDGLDYCKSLHKLTDDIIYEKFTKPINKPHDLNYLCIYYNGNYEILNVRWEDRQIKIEDLLHITIKNKKITLERLPSESTIEWFNRLGGFYKRYKKLQNGYPAKY